MQDFRFQLLTLHDSEGRSTARKCSNQPGCPVTDLRSLVCVAADTSPDIEEREAFIKAVGFQVVLPG